MKDDKKIILPNMLAWLIGVILVFAFLYFLSSILTPFLFGALLAYFINPVVRMLERHHIPHLISVVLVFISFFCATTLIVLILYPITVQQINNFIAFLPAMYEWLQSKVLPWLNQYLDMETVKSAIPVTLTNTRMVVETFLKSGVAVVQTIVEVLLTAVVTFYLLRDWDKVIKHFKELIPNAYTSTVIKLANDCDAVLSAFIRGQLLVILCLLLFYSLALLLIGLQFGFIIGLIGGLLSIVPYLGSAFVLIASLIAAFLQSGFDHLMLLVIIVFLIGQSIEGYILTPYLIGDRIGLHPVAIIFAVMAGGALFGFFGVLLALPTAATLMATLRFFKKKYHYNEA